MGENNNMVMEETGSLSNVLNVMLGKKLANKRRQLGLTQEELSEILSVNNQGDKTRTIQRWEAGKTTVPAWIMAHLQAMETLVVHLVSSKEKHDYLLEWSANMQDGSPQEVAGKLNLWLEEKKTELST